MKEEEKEKLLLKDLSSRLPYGVMIHLGETNEIEELYCLNISQEALYTRNKEHKSVSSLCPIGQCKPYLRSMSSMTEEERKKYHDIDNKAYSCPEDYAHIPAKDRIDWLNANHFDYRGLIGKGLALEVDKDFYK